MACTRAMGRGTSGRILLVSFYGLTAVTQANRQIENKRQRGKDISRVAKEISLLPFSAFIMPVHWGRLPCLATPCLESESEGAAGERNPGLCAWLPDRNQKRVCLWSQLC